MRYSLLDFLSPPGSDEPLLCIACKEVVAELPHVSLHSSLRVPPSGFLATPLPAGCVPAHPAARLLAELSPAESDPSRNQTVDVESGILVSPTTGRWYPIIDFIPELLPDHLRNFDRDFAFLRSLQGSIPGNLLESLDDPTRFSAAGVADEGAHYKNSEMRLTDHLENPLDFFAPGSLAPFNPGSQHHSIYLIRLFSFCASMLQEAGAKVVLDTGCGYAWTTEWLMRLGFEPIGIDINRAYMDVGRARARTFVPYLLVADTENLPIRSASIDAVLGFDSFHHIPNRQAAMAQFDRVLTQSGRVVLGEPNGAHEADAVSQMVMDKYGILERGMELEDVLQYVSGTGLTNVQQIIPLHVNSQEDRYRLTREFVQAHNWSAANLFLLDRSPLERIPPPPSEDSHWAQRCQELEQSLSWRITAPLRAVYGRLLRSSK